MEVIKEMNRYDIFALLSGVSTGISIIVLYRLSILEACMHSMACLHNGGP